MGTVLLCLALGAVIALVVMDALAAGVKTVCEFQPWRLPTDAEIAAMRPSERADLAIRCVAGLDTVGTRRVERAAGDRLGQIARSPRVDTPPSHGTAADVMRPVPDRTPPRGAP